MVSYNLNKQMKWLITITSKRNFLEKDRDFIAELVSEEARKVDKFYSFILHDIIESKKYSKIFIEGTKASLNNLLSVIKANLTCQFTYERYNKK